MAVLELTNSSDERIRKLLVQRICSRNTARAIVQQEKGNSKVEIFKRGNVMFVAKTLSGFQLAFFGMLLPLLQTNVHNIQL
jgi:hypothetical protein